MAVEVTIEVPEGERLAKKTFNPRIGIVGGISIIGTTGVVEPMSMEAIKATVRCEIDVVWAETDASTGRLFLAPGKIGESSLKGLFGDVKVVLTSNFIGEAFQYAVKKGIRHIVIGGHPGKLAKILMGYYNTHSSCSPQATGFVSDYLALEKKDFNTIEEIIQYLKREDSMERLHCLARDIGERILTDFGFTSTEVCLFDMKGNLIGRSLCPGTT